MNRQHPQTGPRALVPVLLAMLACACGDGDPGNRWAGSVDTLASGQVVVANPAAPLWSPEQAWTLTEELRIGSEDMDGPDLFGRVESLAVDPLGRIYVLEGMAQEVRVFEADGRHVRTIGSEGAGPGEFSRALRAEFGPDGHLWVVDPQNNRVSVFDTAGAYLRGHTAAGGFVIIPWPGRFDLDGHYYYPIPMPSAGDFRLGLAKYDAAFQALDTLAMPTDPVDRAFFDHDMGDDGYARVGVPYNGHFARQLSPSGSFWCVVTETYRLFELSQAGDTLRTITRAFDPLPVTDADMAQAREDLEWFIEMGGTVDWSKIPDHKPAVEDFFIDPDGYLWFWPVTPRGEEGTRLEVFDAIGRYLGAVASPTPIATRPAPVIRDGYMYAVTESELDVPFVVRLRIGRLGVSGAP